MILRLPPLAATSGPWLGANGPTWVFAIPIASDQDEEGALHESLTWGGQPGNNSVLQWYGPDLAKFDEGCRELMCQFNKPLPEGSTRARIRYTARECKDLQNGSLADTLGEEAEGFVTIDLQGHPIRYDKLGVYEEVVAEHRACRLDLQVQTNKSGSAWQNVGSSVELGREGKSWRASLREGARQLKNLDVKAGDPHYDAKLFPHVHPYGTGSLLSELGSGGHQKLVRSRALSIQKWFRRSPMWCFWQLDQAVKSALFFQQVNRRRYGRRTADSIDKFAKTYGTVVPASIPETTAWWKRQSSELSAICDDAECGPGRNYFNTM